MNFVSTTAERVPAHTAAPVNARIREATELQVARVAQGGPDAIDRRLAALDREWDVERCLETGAATLSLTGAALGATLNRKWFLLPAVVAGFLLQHAVQGWCPPLALLRRLGVRTADEINEERHALKALRGDFADVAGGVDAAIAQQALEVARRH
jgi:hypothetical protein